MSTIFRQEAIAAFKDRVKQEPEYLTVINDIHHRLISGFYDEWYVDIVFQKWEGYHDGMPDLIDAACFADVHAMIHSGLVGITKIDVGQIPRGDSDITKNNMILRDLPSPFVGEFWGGSTDEDGKIISSEDIWADFVRHTEKKDYNIAIKIKRGIWPLEVGTQSAEKTYMSLCSCAGIARWPYGSTSIYLLSAIKKPPSIKANKGRLATKSEVPWLYAKNIKGMQAINDYD